MKGYYESGVIEAGVDEAGRGCIAGPVVAAAVVFPEQTSFPEFIQDSKKLFPDTRALAQQWILEHCLTWGLGISSVSLIEQKNILQASFLAMNEAIKQLNPAPERLLIDGNHFLNQTQIPHICIVKGDALYASIAAASILAKTFRDELMLLLHQQFPDYQWEKNKGYPTPEHKRLTHQFGLTPFHRKSFCSFLQKTLFD